MPNGRSYSSEDKAAAMADLLNGDQPAVVAKRYGINVATVRSWKNRFEIVNPDDNATVLPSHATDNATVATPRQQPNLQQQQYDLGQLIFQNLRAKLEATQKIVEQVDDHDWRSKQSATGLAELFQAIDDSAVRILDRVASRPRSDADENT